jgi:polysaccharide export outer membrane protein
MMTKLRRMFRNVPLLRLGVALLLVGAAFFSPPAFAAETLGADPSADLPASLSPEQAEMAKGLLETNADARKALEAAKQQKAQTGQQMKKAADTEKEAIKKELAPKTDAAAATTAKAELIAAAAQRYDWRKSPYVGSLFGKRLSDAEKESISHFGHELFSPASGAATLLENIPVAPGYVVGPGDEIVVKMWGRVEGTQRMVVDRDGKVFLPKFGSLYVAGKTFEEVRAFLKAKVSTIAEVSSDVTLGQMKGIRISVVGEVIAPGWYNISSLHTALQALAMAGGMKDIGSLRRIRILRGGTEVREIDLYDFLLSGDTRADIRLLQGDVIFVPVVGKMAAIAGEVRRPAIYELRHEKTVLDLVKVAGGFTPSAWKQRLQVERLEGNVSRIVLDAGVEELEKGRQAMDLADGDIVRVFPIVAADVNVVTLEGNVVRPGKYELKPGMTVGALVKDVKDFLPETYFDYALLTRLVPPDLHKEIVPVNLRAIVLEGKKDADIPLKAQDLLTVYNRSAFRDTQKVTVSGEVRRPGTFDLKKGSRITDLVKLAGDLTKVSWLPRAEVVRIDEKMRTFRTIYFDLGKAMAGDEKENLLLEDEDQVRIHSLWETQYKKTVTVAGDVNNPGEQILTEGMRLSDLLFKAGGFKESAFTKEAELVRRQLNDNGALVMTEAIVVHPEKVLAGEKDADLSLRPFDQLIVRSIPTWGVKYDRIVAASGDLRAPGEFVLTAGMKLSDLLFRAGGFTKSAYTKEGELIRREIDPRGDLVKTQTLVVFPDRALAGDPAANLPLKEYDLLVVRQIPEWAEKIAVTLSGEVQFPGVYAAKKGERLSSLVTRAGGFTKAAYLKATFFSRVSTQKTQQEAIDKLIADLELEVAQKGQQVGGALDKEDVEANKELVASRFALIAQLKKARAKGRVIIRIADNGKVEGTLGDILLEDGDRLDVPKKMNVVNVVGRVYNPTGIVFDPARDSVGYYLRMVGGPTESADRDHIFVLKADGSVATRETSNPGFFAFAGGGLMNARVEPGDSILVPEKLVQTRVMKDVKDITQILYQIAVTAGVLIVAF